MGKKAREYKSGDFIFAKVKGYPAWPARVQRLNGKKYFVYFYGTGETANLPPNMIFDYAENKEKFLNKTQKRRDFIEGVKQIEHDFANKVPLEEVIGVPMEVRNSFIIFYYAENKEKFLNKAQKRRDFIEGVKQIEHDFANKVPLEEVIGVPMEVGVDAVADDTANDSAINDTMDETADTTAANDTADDDTINNTTQNDGEVEDSDENGALVIDEGKGGKKKGKADAAKTPAKETPKAKEPKTPRGKAKKDETKKEDKEKPEEVEEQKKEEEIVSRSGRKIRPKRFVDEHTEENSTLPSPAPKRRRAASPLVEKEKDKPEPKDRSIKSFNAVSQSALEDLKQPFKPEDSEKENIVIAYLPTGKYVGIKLFQSRPTSFKNESSRLQWDKQAASNALTLRMQLERGQITPLSVQAQLVMDLNLTDEEKAILDKERETEEKKSRVQFLKNEMKLIELDAKIKTCLSLEKADTDLCLKMLDELIELDVKPLMLLKHPTCLETVKRMRAYVGNTPSWDLSEEAALLFSKQAHRIRKQADSLYKTMKELFTTPDGLSFWEHFSERVLQFKKIAAKLSASELLEMVHEPIEMSQPTSHTMRAAIDAANEKEDDEPPKKKATPAKPKKAANNTTPVSKSKRQSNRKQVEPEAEKNSEPEDDSGETPEQANKDAVDNPKEAETVAPVPAEDVEMADATKDIAEPTASDKESEVTSDKESGKSDKAKDAKKGKNAKEGKRSARNAEKNAKDAEKAGKDAEKTAKEAIANKEAEDSSKNAKASSKDTEDSPKDAENAKDAERSSKDADSSSKEAERSSKDADSSFKDAESNSKDAEKPKETEANGKKDKSPKKSSKDREKSPRDKNSKETEKSSEDAEKNPEEPETEAESTQNTETNDKVEEAKEKTSNKKDENKKGDKNSTESEKNSKESSKDKESEKRKADDKADEKTKEEFSEPRVKRSRDTRESKKTEAPPPRSPNKRKSKF